jgi:alcohol dehydrogenase (cytochrome c)
VDVPDRREQQVRSDAARDRRTLYITGALNHAWAIDGRTGRQIWHYERSCPRPEGLLRPREPRLCRLGDRLFMVTLDAHFVALEMKTGKVIYDIEMATVKDGFAGDWRAARRHDK